MQGMDNCAPQYVPEILIQPFTGSAARFHNLKELEKPGYGIICICNAKFCTSFPMIILYWTTFSNLGRYVRSHALDGRKHGNIG